VTPAVAVIVCAYGTVAVHGGSGDEVAMVTGGFTTTVKLLLAVADWLSVAVALKVYDVTPLTNGAVPLSSPWADKVSHEGKFVPIHVTVPIPPEEPNVCE